MIELLVVIAIVGVMSSVVLSNLNSARAKSQDTKRISEIRAMRNALEFYYDNTGRYPCIVPTCCQCNNALSGLAATLVPTYITKIPTDPIWTGADDYRYAGGYSAVGNSYPEIYTIRIRKADGTYCIAGQNRPASWWLGVPDCPF